MNIDNIPYELRYLIFSYLSPIEREISKEVSRSWHRELNQFSFPDPIIEEHRQALKNVKTLREYDFTKGQGKFKLQVIINTEGKLIAFCHDFNFRPHFTPISENTDTDFKLKLNQFFLRGRNLSEVLSDANSYYIHCDLDDASANPHFSLSGKYFSTLRLEKADQIANLMVDVFNQMAIQAAPLDRTNSLASSGQKLEIDRGEKRKRDSISSLIKSFNALYFQPRIVEQKILIVGSNKLKRRRTEEKINLIDYFKYLLYNFEH